MDWALYIFGLANPFVGMTIAIPFALNIRHLPTAGVAALVIPVNLMQILLLHALWQWLLQRPRVAAWIESRRSARVARWLETSGAILAAVAATFVLGSVPTYISLRFLGAPFRRIALGVAVGCALFGGAMTGICRAVGY
ncbi:MAG TPA: hypothetical protein VHF22_10765 [Planctomycetota bacterium]|nr:hypothetical protein [Planctomycetota bacterium]